MCRVTETLRPTDRLVRTLLAPALVFVATSIDRNYQTDLWHHLARGRVLIEEGVLLDSDRFTYTVAGQEFRDVNWGWQAAFFWLYRAGGLQLVQATNSALLALMMGLLVAQARRLSGSPIVACMCCVAAFAGLWPLLIIRPQTLSLLMFVMLQIALDAARERKLWLLAAPPILAIWVNVHGGFPVGLVLIAAHALASVVPIALRDAPASNSRWRMCVRSGAPWLACLALCVAATLLNPYRWHVYEYVGLTSSRAAGRHIDEWLPPGLDTLTGKVFALSVAAAIVLLAMPGDRPVRLSNWIVAACFLPAAFGSVRMVAWWLLICTPLLAERLAAAWPRLRVADADDVRTSRSAGVVLALLLAASILSLPWFERWNPVFLIPGRGHRTETDLQAAVDHLKSSDRGCEHVFTRFAWGEYLGWALAGQGTVFMDGRIEIYPDDVWAQYAAITRGRADWQQLLDRYGVDCLLLDAGGYDGQLLTLVAASREWREEFRQGTAVLFVRVSQPETHGPQTGGPKAPADLRTVAGE